jgi:serine/threonine protein phosphatase PrpC
LGDYQFAPVGIINEPFETTVHFSTGWLVAASDGVWDVVSPADLDGLLWNAASADVGAHRVAVAAFDRGSTDNVTVVAVRRWVD